MDKIKSKTKKAQGHIEVIISFVIFLGFLVFLVIIFEPFKSPTNPGIVDSVLVNLDKKVGVSVKTISINLNAPPIRCIRFDNPNLTADSGCTPTTIIVKDKDEKVLDSKLDNSMFFVNTTNQKFFTIYCGSSLEAIPPLPLIGCTELTNVNYSLGIIVEKNLWSMEKLTLFDSEYKTNYLVLKDEIVSNPNDFGLVVSDLNDNIIFSMKGEIPRGVEVNSKTFPIEIINKTASVKMVKANVLVW